MRSSQVLILARQGPRRMPRVSPGKALVNRSTEEIVGRTAEIEVLLSSLESTAPSIWYVHGIAGIGKSTLLRAFASAVGRKGSSVIWLDGRSIEPTTAGFLASLSQQAGRDIGVANLTTTFSPPATAIVIDNYESLTLLDGWIRQVLVPALPSSALLVLAAREPPGPGWRRDSPCNVMLRTLALRTLDRIATEQLLTRFGLAQERANTVNQVVAGHPLAIVLAGSKLRDWAGAMADVLVDVNVDLAQLYLSGIDNKDLREAIEAASVVRRVTTRCCRRCSPPLPRRRSSSACGVCHSSKSCKTACISMTQYAALLPPRLRFPIRRASAAINARPGGTSNPKRGVARLATRGATRQT